MSLNIPPQVQQSVKFGTQNFKDTVSDKVAEEVAEQQAKLFKRMSSKAGQKLKQLAINDDWRLGVRRYPKEGGVRDYAKSIWWKSMAAGAGVPILGSVITSAVSLGFVNPSNMRELLVGTGIASAWGTSVHLSRKAGRMEEAVLGIEKDQITKKLQKEQETNPDYTKISPEVRGTLEAYKVTPEELKRTYGLDPFTVTPEEIMKKL